MKQQPGRRGAERLVGASACMRRVRSQLRSAARYHEPTLIVGETGTGKELAARALHEESARAQLPLQIIHCAGLGTDVLFSELFGHTQGAFTGATGRRDGRIVAADGSTVVLDEITETTPAFQAAVLRTIERGEVQPVGSDGSRRVDVRFVATTNRSVEELRDPGVLRTDLFFRLAAFTLHLPPLRERQADLAELAAHLLGRLSRRYGRDWSLSAAAEARLREHEFPGNVRELRQVLLRASATSDTDEIGASAVADALEIGSEEAAREPGRHLTLEQVVRRHIRATLESADGNLSQAARLLGVPRSTLQHYLVKYRVATPGRAAGSAAGAEAG